MMTTPTNSSFPAHAIVACPGGPRITTYVGRKDSTNPAPGGLLPDVHASGDSLFALFAALLGAHSTSKQFNTDTSNAALLHQRQQLRRNVLRPLFSGRSVSGARIRLPSQPPVLPCALFHVPQSWKASRIAARVVIALRRLSVQ